MRMRLRRSGLTSAISAPKKWRMRAGRILAMTLVATAGIVAAAPAAQATGYTGTFVLWQEGRNEECMVPNALTSGSKVVVWTGCANANYPDMWWQSEYIGDDTYKLRNNANLNLCLAVPNGSKNAQAIVATCNSSDTRQWWREVNNQYRPDAQDLALLNRYSGYCLTSEQTSANSDKVVQWDCAYWFEDLWWYFHEAHVVGSMQ